MTLKGLLGFCECKGCKKRAIREIIVKRNVKFTKMIVCEDCIFNF